MLLLCQSFLRLPVAWLVRENMLLSHFSWMKMSLSFLHKFQFMIPKLEFTTDMEPDNNMINY